MTDQQNTLLPWWWLIIIFNTLLVFGPIAIDWLRGRLDLLNCRHIFAFFFWLQFCLWPAWVLLAGYRRFDAIHIYFIDEYADETLPGLLLATMALVCFYAGYYFVPQRVLTTARRLMLTKLDRGFGLTLRWTGLLYAILGTLAGLAFLHAAGGWQVIFHIDEFRTTTLAGFGPYFMGLNFLGFAALFYHYRSAAAGQWPWGAIILFPVAIGLSAICGYRHMLLSCIVYIAVIRHYLVRQFRLNAAILLLAAVFMLANLSYVSFRSTGSPLEMFNQIQNVFELAWQGFFSRFHGIESLTRIMHVTKSDGQHLGLGRIVLDFFNSFVPRKFFPNKPDAIGVTVNLKFFGDRFTGGEGGACVATLLGDLYWMGGPGAIAAGTLCLGLMARITRQFLYRARKNPLGIILYCQLYVFFFFINDDLFLHASQLVQRCILILGPLAVLHFVLSRAGNKNNGTPASRDHIVSCAS